MLDADNQERILFGELCVAIKQLNFHPRIHLTDSDFASITAEGTLCDNQGRMDHEQFEWAMRRQIRLFAQRQLASALMHEVTGELEFAQMATMKMIMLSQFAAQGVSACDSSPDQQKVKKVDRRRSSCYPGIRLASANTPPPTSLPDPNVSTRESLLALPADVGADSKPRSTTLSTLSHPGPAPPSAVVLVPLAVPSVTIVPPATFPTSLARAKTPGDDGDGEIEVASGQTAFSSDGASGLPDPPSFDIQPPCSTLPSSFVASPRQLPRRQSSSAQVSPPPRTDAGTSDQAEATGRQAATTGPDLLAAAGLLAAALAPTLRRKTAVVHGSSPCLLSAAAAGRACAAKKCDVGWGKPGSLDLSRRSEGAGGGGKGDSPEGLDDVVAALDHGEDDGGSVL